MGMPYIQPPVRGPDVVAASSFAAHRGETFEAYTRRREEANDEIMAEATRSTRMLVAIAVLLIFAAVLWSQLLPGFQPLG